MAECNIQVAVKIRPLIKRELDKSMSILWRKEGDSLKDNQNHYETEFHFDLIFDESSTINDMFVKIAQPLVTKAVSGINGTIFAYGQTCSGKTYTMMGDGHEQEGLIMKTIKYLFSNIQDTPNQEFVLRVGFIEIYNEKIFDLLDPENIDLQIIEKNKEVTVNFKEIMCKSVDDMYNAILQGNQNKKMSETDMNERSSRSHTIFHITIESIEADSDTVKISYLNLVDLAGSERVTQTHSTGARFVEGTFINKSLLSLSLVINKLINNDRKYINYRDSKLTRYLQSSLGGNALAAIICTITPAALEETFSTLQFASRAMKVQNRPRVNEIVSDATMIKKLHREIEILQTQLNEKNERTKNEPYNDNAKILQQLIYHRGNILNYHTIETQKMRQLKLRRRTWATFESDMDPIPEVQGRVTDFQAESEDVQNEFMLNNPLVTAERMPHDLDTSLDFVDEDNYRTKYHNLLRDYEELQEFTDAERDLNAEPDVKRDLLERIDTLESQDKKLRSRISTLEQENNSKEFLFEQHHKKAENREKDLLDLIEETKKTSSSYAAVAEKSKQVAELEESLLQLQAENKDLSEKVAKYGYLEHKLSKMESVQVELEELRNTIINLTNNISVLENEKKEMSVRLNESAVSAMNFDVISMTTSTIANDVLKAEYEEMSTKVVDLLQENEELKQKLDENEQEYEKIVLQLHTVQAQLEEGLEQPNASRNLMTMSFESIQMVTKVSPVDEAHDKIKELEAVIASKVNIEDDLNQRLDRNATLIKELEEKLKELESNILSKCEIETGLYQKLEDSQIYVKSLEAQKCGLENQVEATNKSVIDLNKQIVESTELIKELETTNNLLQDKIQESIEAESVLRSSNEEMETEICDLQRKISDLETKNGLIQSLLDKLKQISSKDEEMDISSSEQMDISKDIHTVDHGLLVSEKQQIQDLEAEILSKTEMEKELKISEAELKLKVEELLAKISNLEEKELEVLQKNTELQDIKETHEVKLTSLQSTIDDLESQMRLKQESENVLAVKCETIEAEKQEIESTIRELELQLNEQKEVFNKEKEALQSKVEELVLKIQEQLCENSQEKEKLTKAIEVLEQQIEEQRQEISELQSKFTTDQAELDRKIKEVELALNEQTRVLNYTNADLLRSKEESEELVEELRLEKSLQEANYRKEKEDLLAQIDEIRLKLIDQTVGFEDERNELLKSLEETRQEIEKKSKENNDLQAELIQTKESTGDNQLFEKQISELKSEKDRQNGEIQKFKQQIDNLFEETKQVKHESGKLLMDIELRDAQLIELQSQIDHLERAQAKNQETKSSRDSLVQELNAQVRSLEETVLDTEREVMEKSDIIIDLKHKVEELQKTKGIADDLEKNYLVLKRLHEQLSAELSDIEGEKKSLLEQISNLHTQLKTQQKTIAEHEEAICGLNKSLSEAVQKVSHLSESKASGFEKEKKTLEDKIKVLQTDFEAQQLFIKQREVEITNLRQTLADHQNQLASMKDLETALNETRQKYGLLLEERTKLQQDLEKKKAIELELIGKIQTFEFSEMSSREDFKLQNKERRARRSSTFNNNRYLSEYQEIGTMTDPTTEMCNCVNLDKMVKDLKKQCMVKDCEIVNWKNEYKSSPMLLENYNMKKMIAEFKVKLKESVKEVDSLNQKLMDTMREARNCKVCERNSLKSLISKSTQSLPDPNERIVTDLKQQLALKSNKYEEAQRICALRNEKINELELFLSNIKENEHRNTEDQSTETYRELLRKYAITKKIVQERKERIIKLEATCANYPSSCPTCGVCLVSS